VSTLHTINQSWQAKSWLFEQLSFASFGDAILLIEEGVLALQSPVALASFVAKSQANEIALYALEEDLLQRGVESQYQSIKQISYTEMVNLVTQHKKQVAW